MRWATMGDEPGGMAAALRRVTLERDQARWMVETLKGQCKSLRQKLRREVADHRQTQIRLAEVLRERG